MAAKALSRLADGNVSGALGTSYNVPVAGSVSVAVLLAAAGLLYLVV